MSDAPHDLVALGALLYADDQLEEARVQLEAAFVGLRELGDLRTAAVVAGRLGELHAGSLGNEAVGRGWMERGRELLEQVGPCVEWGYWELARLACDRPDLDDLTASTERALAIAREFGDVGLEARALADSGLALVTKGRVREGFARLDQALATLSSGEVGDPYVVGTSLCSLLSSCDRAGDVERAIESIRLVETLLLQPFDGRPRVLGTHCKLAFGSVLCAAGRWTEGEAALLEAIGPDASKSRGHRVEAQSRLAEVRVHQGRLDDAAELLATIEDSVAAAGPLALVHLRRGQPELAAAVLRHAVRRMVSDVLRVRRCCRCWSRRSWPGVRWRRLARRRRCSTAWRRWSTPPSCLRSPPWPGDGSSLRRAMPLHRWLRSSRRSTCSVRSTRWCAPRCSSTSPPRTRRLAMQVQRWSQPEVRTRPPPACRPRRSSTGRRRCCARSG
jgi:tetratricopeptide (TPR) repeat protein